MTDDAKAKSGIKLQTMRGLPLASPLYNQHVAQIHSATFAPKPHDHGTKWPSFSISHHAQHFLDNSYTTEAVSPKQGSPIEVKLSEAFPGSTLNVGMNVNPNKHKAMFSVGISFMINKGR